jgi:hypothetical protein
MIYATTPAIVAANALMETYQHLKDTGLLNITAQRVAELRARRGAHQSARVLRSGSGDDRETQHGSDSPSLTVMARLPGEKFRPILNGAKSPLGRVLRQGKSGLQHDISGAAGASQGPLFKWWVAAAVIFGAITMDFGAMS